jgi:hypothetical protein
MSVVPTGVNGIGSVGSLATIQALALSLAGVSSTTTLGTILKTIGITPSAITANTTIGSLSSRITISATGITAFSGIGTLAVGPAYTVSVSGTSLVSSVGSVVPSITSIDFAQLYRDNVSVFVEVIGTYLVVTTVTNYNSVTQINDDVFITNTTSKNYVTSINDDVFIQDTREYLVA